MREAAYRSDQPVIVTIRREGVPTALKCRYVETVAGPRGAFVSVKLDDGRDYKARPSNVTAA